MSLRKFALAISVFLGFTLTGCDGVQAEPSGGHESSSSQSAEEVTGESTGMPSQTDEDVAGESSGQSEAPSAPSTQAVVTGFEAQPGPDPKTCSELDLGLLDTVTPNKKEISLRHQTGFIECDSWYEDQYMEAAKPAPNASIAGVKSRAIYMFTHVITDADDSASSKMKKLGGHVKEAVGPKSGEKMYGIGEGTDPGFTNVVQVFADLDSKWYFFLEVNSVLMQPISSSELMKLALATLDSLLADEQGNNVIRDAITTPVKKPASHLLPSNEAEEAVDVGLKAALSGNHIAVADHFTDTSNDNDSTWFGKLADELAETGENNCRYAITDSRLSVYGSWTVVIDVTHCPALYESYLYEGGFKEVAFVAWAVQRYSHLDGNYAIWKRGEAAPSPDEARWALETLTLKVYPEGWTSKENEAENERLPAG